MLKILNIATLFIFVSFLITPTITFAFNIDTEAHTLILNEEEETHSKTKSSNNNLNEEEEKEVNYYFSQFFKISTSKKNTTNKNLVNFKNTIKDDLVFKIPLPPPEQTL